MVTTESKDSMFNRAVIRNLRRRWPKELEHLTNELLVSEYSQFMISDYSGDNDARFLEWIGADE